VSNPTTSLKYHSLLKFATATRPTQPSILPGLVNEYQFWLGGQRQVWFILLADKHGVCR